MLTQSSLFGVSFVKVRVGYLKKVKLSSRLELPLAKA